KNVLLEGLSDFYYFRAMRDILQRNQGYKFVPGVGVRKINSLVSMCIGYGLPWVAVIDGDPTQGGTDSKKKFDEIKSFVFDDDEKRTKERVHVLDGIVGIENMFTIDDLKLVDPKLPKKQDVSAAVGAKRKILFATAFFEKVKAGEITEAQVSQTCRD